MLGASSSFLSAFLSSSRTLHLSIRSCTAVGYFLLSSAFTLDRFSDAAQRTEPPDFSLLSMRGTDDPSAQKNQSQQHEPHRRTRSLSRTLKQRGASDSRHTGAAVSGESLRSFYWAGRRVCGAMARWVLVKLDVGGIFTCSTSRSSCAASTWCFLRGSEGCLHGFEPDWLWTADAWRFE